MSGAIRDVGAGAWRVVKNLWINVGGTYQKVKKAWVWNGSAWQQWYLIAKPTLAAAVVIVGEPQTGDVRVSWTSTGDATGYTLKIYSACFDTGFTLRYSGADGGSSPQTIPYWGSASTDPADPNERMDTDADINVELSNGVDDAFDSPQSFGHGLPT